MTPIQASDLRPGDVLLSLGEGDLSNAIRVFDGGSYSHAALWTGAEVIEAGIPVVRQQSLDATLAGLPVLLDVYRHSALGNKAADVAREARAYLGRPYSYGDIALAALVVSTSTWIPTSRWQTRFLLEACGLNRLLRLDRARAGELVTCTELLTRAFFDAGAPFHVVPTSGGHFDVDVLFRGVAEITRAALRQGGPLEPPEDPAEEWQRVQSQLRARFAELAGVEPPVASVPVAHVLQGGVAGPPRPLIAGSEWGANLVTPSYVERSPDMRLVGRLFAKPGAVARPSVTQASPLS